MKKLLVVGVIILLVVGLGGYSLISSNNQGSHQPDIPEPTAPDPRIDEMIQQVDENEIYSSVYDLQNFPSRHYGNPGNVEASAYLYDKLSSIPGLAVEYQGGDLRNVVATLPGRYAGSDEIFMVGAHYDSTSEPDEGDAPGATDNGGGVAIVLELARVMSQYSFNNTIKFSLWNAEEGNEDHSGSGTYVDQAVDDHQNIILYLNFDSACYDPEGRLVLDIMFNERSQWASELMTKHNDLYGIGFNLTNNVHRCGSDHMSFWGRGYAAVMTHAETHGPSHSPDDTIDKVSTLYAKKNGQLGMSVLARLAEVG